MSRCEDEKMRYRPPLLEEPCAQTLSGKIHKLGHLPHNAATEEPKMEYAQNPRQYVLPIKYVVGLQLMEQGRADKIRTKQAQTRNQTERSDRREVSKQSTIRTSLPSIEIEEREKNNYTIDKTTTSVDKSFCPLR